MKYIEKNKAIYIIIFLFAIIILCSIMLFKIVGDSDNNSTDITVDNSVNTTEVVNNNTNLSVENKYPDANWVKLDSSKSASVDFDTALVTVSLGHLNEGVTEKYKVVKIICTIYKESTNKVIGTSETYYEDVELKYGFFSFRETIDVKLSTPFVGNDFTSTVEVYAIPE